MKGFLPFILFSGIAAIGSIHAEVRALSPFYFNAAYGRPIHASATCGESGSEVYCNLVGAISNVSINEDKYCGKCEKGVEGTDHSEKYALDWSDSHWWQSPSLARGLQFHEVNLTIDLQQMLEVHYVTMRMANSPRPRIWVLERSSDNGKTFQPWQYFAGNQIECERFFGPESILPVIKDDSVICDTHQTKIVPLENGEIFVRLTQGRPGSRNFFQSEALQQFLRATHIRFRFLKLTSLMGHLSQLAKRDPIISRNYFYAVKNIEVGGRCICNGHADSCIPAPENPKQLQCVCEHNTCGDQCQACCPGFDGYPNCAPVPEALVVEKKKRPFHFLGWWFSV